MSTSRLTRGLPELNALVIPQLTADADRTYAREDMGKTFVLTPTATRVQTLPTTGIEAGEVISFVNLSDTFAVTVEASGGQDIWTFIGKEIVLRAAQDEPTTQAHWRVIKGKVGIIDSQVTQVGNVGAGEDDLMTFTLLANTLDKDGQALKITAAGGGNVTHNVTLKFHFGSTILTLTSGAVQGNWSAEFTVVRRGATAQVLVGFYHDPNTTIAGEVTVPSETLSGAVVIKFTGENTTDSTDDAVTQLLMLTEFVG